MLAQRLGCCLFVGTAFGAKRFYCTVQVFPSALTQVEPLMLVN
jgi:hypothetical protein